MYISPSEEGCTNERDPKNSQESGHPPGHPPWDRNEEGPSSSKKYVLTNVKRQKGCERLDQGRGERSTDDLDHP